MYNEDMISDQRKLANQALALSRDLLPLMAPVGSHPRWNPEQRYTLGMLLSAAARSTESFLLLVAYRAVVGCRNDSSFGVRRLTEVCVHSSI